MQQHLKSALGEFVLENFAHRVVGFARMHDQRQAAVARGGDMGAENLRLHVARAVIVMKIESAFADADHLRLLRQFQQVARGQVRVFARLMRMRAHRRPDIAVRLGQRVNRVEIRDAVADIQHQPNARLTRTRDDRLAVLIELRRMQVDVRINILTRTHQSS